MPGRVQITRQLGCMARSNLIQQHDWVFCASRQPNSCIAPMEVLSLGVPVIAFDVPPHNELVAHGHNGALLPVGYSVSWLGACYCNPEAYPLLESLSSVLADDCLLERVQSRSWSDLLNHRQAFRHLWHRILTPSEPSESEVVLGTGEGA